MTKKDRIEYLACTLSVFVTGFLIYGSLANTLSFEPVFWPAGCLGGGGFSAMVSTLILSVRFFKKRGTAFRIAAAVLWPVTFGVCGYVGLISYIPYQIYNIVKLISMVRHEKKYADWESRQNNQ